MPMRQRGPLWAPLVLGRIVTHIHFEKTSVTHCPSSSWLLLAPKEWMWDRGLRLRDANILEVLTVLLEGGVYDRERDIVLKTYCYKKGL